ncbi:MAG: alpha/beta hydrolase [Microthrixaceae bacterium]
MRRWARGSSTWGLPLAVLEERGGERPLLLVHGFTGSKEDFADELQLLAELGFHVVAPDLRGHGDSAAPQEEAEYGLDRFADDLFGLCDGLGWSHLDLLGHSMGGMIAQVMALRRPDRIDRLVLMDTHHGVMEDLDRELIELGATGPDRGSRSHPGGAQDGSGPSGEPRLRACL